MWFFLIQRPESVEPQLSDHSPPSHRSLPTSSSCYCGQSSSLVRPATAPFPVLEAVGREGGKRGMERGMGLMARQKEKRQRSRDGAHMSKQLKDARRGSGSSRLMFMKQMEWVSEREGEKKGGRVMGSKVREALLLSPSQRERRERERERERRVGGKEIYYSCVWDKD